MDAKHTANVVFFNVSDTYAVKWHGDITCYFTVDASILPGIRHIVGIFPVNWQSTKDCIVCDWSPMPKDYQPQQPLDNCLKFSGESLRPHADTFDKTLFQFCYIDGTDCVQGMSCSFHLVAASPISHSSVPSESAAAVASCHSEPIDGDEDDFVEIEDEDGEIVIIKSRTAFLQDEVKKLESAAKVRESKLEEEKAVLVRQMDELRGEVARLSSEKESLRDLMVDSEREHSVRLMELQQKYMSTQAELLQAQQDLCRASSSRWRESCQFSSPDAVRHVDVVLSAAGASDAEEHPFLSETQTARQSTDAAESAAAEADCTSDSVSSKASPSSDALPVPGTPSSAADCTSDQAESSPSSTATCEKQSRTIFRFPVLREVGLNVISHLKQSMDQFAPDMDEHYDLEPGVARPMLSAFDRSPAGVGRSQSDQSVRSSGILRPPSSITATAVASVSNVQCPFCLVNFYPGRRPLEEQLVDHIISSCGLKDRQ